MPGNIAATLLAPSVKGTQGGQRGSLTLPSRPRHPGSRLKSPGLGRNSPSETVHILSFSLGKRLGANTRCEQCARPSLLARPWLCCHHHPLLRPPKGKMHTSDLLPAPALRPSPGGAAKSRAPGPARGPTHPSFLPQLHICPWSQTPSSADLTQPGPRGRALAQHKAGANHPGPQHCQAHCSSHHYKATILKSGGQGTGTQARLDGASTWQSHSAGATAACIPPPGCSMSADPPRSPVSHPTSAVCYRNSRWATVDPGGLVQG